MGDSKYGPRMHAPWLTRALVAPRVLDQEEQVRCRAAADDHLDLDSDRAESLPQQQAEAATRALAAGSRKPGPRPGKGATPRRIRLCLHALRISVRWPGDAAGGVGGDEYWEGSLAEQQRRRQGLVLTCLAQVPEDMLQIAEMAGISRQQLLTIIQRFEGKSLREERR